MEALALIDKQEFDVVVTDVMMPGVDGLELLRRIKTSKPEIEVIIMTGRGSISDAVKATKDGAFDYLTKPFTEIEDCINKVRKAARLKRLHDENVALRQRVESGSGNPLLESHSPAMKPVLNQVAQVARVSSSVLITGPTGSGKSVLARAIHERSGRREGPFVAVDCSSIQPQLIESELFGHMKGAFTSAVSDKPGLFEMADGGTIFLDEIGDMPLALQSRLLRALQESVIRRVGGNKDIEIDVRVISATQIDLRKAIESNEFRSDLYFRLRVVEIRLPGLPERREDIPRLAYHFLRQTGKRIGAEFKSISPRCMEALKAHDWKGHVRELEHVVEHAMVLENGQGEELTERFLPPELFDEASPAEAANGFSGQVNLDLPLREALSQAETAFRVVYLQGLMNRFRNVSAAARHAQVDRSNFRRLLRRYGITDYPKGQVGADAKDG